MFTACVRVLMMAAFLTPVSTTLAKAEEKEKDLAGDRTLAKQIGKEIVQAARPTAYKGLSAELLRKLRRRFPSYNSPRRE